MTSIFRTASGFFFHAKNENNSVKKTSDSNDRNDTGTTKDDVATIAELVDTSLHFIPAEAHLIKDDNSEIEEEGQEDVHDYDNEDEINSNNGISRPNYFDWKIHYPELKILYKNISVINNEMKNVIEWTPWPEELSYGLKNDNNVNDAGDWKVVPFLHTFPALDDSKMTWIGSTCTKCPKTVELLKQIPNVRTALFSRLSAQTSLKFHTGWADLANHVLRCHICLDIPEDNSCGLEVGGSSHGEIKYHKQDEIIVFDDSKAHRAFNCSDRDRIVLIIDILRPSGVALGTATGYHTDQLDEIIDKFK